MEAPWSFISAAILGDPLATRLIYSKTAGGFGCFVFLCGALKDV